METELPSPIKARHRARAAAVYTRQSSAAQVAKNIGSTFHQRDLVEQAVSWGWPRDEVTLIEDLGLSGAATEHRAGYLQLVKMVEHDEIGVILIADFSRGGRDDLAWLRLLTLCRAHDTLIWADGRLYDMSDPADHFTARMMTSVAQYDNESRRAAMIRGRDAKVRRGLPVTAAPAGYVRDQGRWVKDPDPAVRNAIAAVFRGFRKGGSYRKTLDYLREWGVRLPRRTTRGVRWKEPSIGLLQAIIKHPAYAGDLVYRRQCTDPTKDRNKKGRLRLRKARPDEMLVARDAHEPYISREEYEANQRRLAVNSNYRGRGKIGRGPALVQSLLRCAWHRSRALAPAYKPVRRDGGQSYSYFCGGDYDTGGHHCVRLPGGRVDRSVVQSALEHLTPSGIDQVREEYERLRDDERGELYRLETELRSVSQKAADIKFRYEQADHANRYVRRDLEKDLNEALQRKERLGRQLERERSQVTSIHEAVFTEAVELSRDLDKIFWAPTTTHMERKQILRLLLDEVRVIAYEPEGVTLELVWSDGSQPSIQVVKLAEYARRRIAELAEDNFPSATIAEVLNAEGLTTKYDAPWTANAVNLVIRRLRRTDADPPA